MPAVNLLPWREERRRKLKRDFMLGLVCACVAGTLVAYGCKLVLDTVVARQTARNAVLRAGIAALDRQNEAILDLETERDRLLARMGIIDRLQRSRPGAVHLFDELLATLPDGVRLTAVRQTAARIEISGIAASSRAVSTLMRNIEISEWLADPRLDVVETVDDEAPRAAAFTIFVRQISLPGALEAAPP